MTCLDENTLLAFVDGSLSSTERAGAEAHFDQCDECRQLAVALVGTESDTVINGASGSSDLGSADVMDTITSPTTRGPEAELRPGDRVDQYVLLRLVGRGGMGRVWLARDTTLGRKVALKLIPGLAAQGDQGADQGADPKVGQGVDPSADRFGLEARVTARFNHPHIVTLYGVGVVGQTPYLALEYVEGQTLRERMDEDRPGLREGLRIGLAVAEATAEAHRHGVLHRDLKPQNVILAKDGRLRVLDFGLALPTGGDGDGDEDEGEGKNETKGADAPSGQGTGPRLTFGTPAYMAPEQWLGEPATPATDVWALGGMLHELFTGRRFYDHGPEGRRRKSEEIRTAVCSLESVPSLGHDALAALGHDEVGPGGLTPELVTLVDRCLRKDPAERPSVEALLEGLRSVLHREKLSEGIDQLPFRGLLPLTERHAGLFFGRDTELGSFLERLREEPVLPVVGPSGAGKSSFVMAGVIPRLREHARWLVLRMRPGNNPFETLAARLELGDTGVTLLGEPDGSLSGTPDIRPEDAPPMEEWLATHPTRLTLELARLAEAQKCRVLLFVDQLEELYTLVDDEETRRAFMRGLCTAADDREGPVRVIFTLRDDFLWRLAEGEEAQAVLGRIVVLRPPGPEALTEFLERSAEAVGYRYEPPTLPREMVREVEGEVAALPLLQFAGQQIWERRDRQTRVLDQATYEDVGGVAGALAQHADAVLAALPPQHERLAKTLLLRLVTPESTRRVVPRQELLKGLGDHAPEVLERLTAARAILVRRGLRGPPVLELVHESLIRTWDRLAHWLEESREERTFLTEVGQAAALWDQRGRLESEVWEGDALALALRQAARCTGLSDRTRQFLQAGRRRQERGAKRRRLTLVIGFGLLALVALSALLFSLVLRQKEQEAQDQRREAQRQRQHALLLRQEALRQGTSSLLDSAQSALDRGSLIEARAKLRQVLEEADSPLARALWIRLQHSPLRWKKRLGAILYDVAFSPDNQTVAVASLDHAIHLFDVDTGQRRVLRGHADQVMAVAFTPDGQRLASSTWAGDVWLWDLRTGKSRVFGRHPKGVNALTFNADGTRLATASSDKTARIWDTKTGRVVTTLKGHLGAVLTIRFHPDGRGIATGSLDGTVRFWDPRTGHEQQRIRASSGAVQSLAYHPDGHLLATAGEDRAVRLWDTRTGKASGLRMEHQARVTHVHFGPRGHLLASASADKTVRLLNTETGRVIGVVRGHDGPVRSVKISHDGRLLATVSEDGHVRLWSIAKATSPPLLGGHQGAIMGMSFHPKGGQLATSGVDRTVRLWDTTSGRVIRVLRGHQAQVLGISYNPDGTRLASGGYDQVVRIWEPTTGRVVAVLRGHQGPIFDVSYSPDGRTLASSSYDRTVRLWNLSTGRVKAVLRGHSARIFDVRFSPSGRRLVTTSADRTARLWDVATGRALDVIRGHQNTVRGASFSPDGRTLATGGVDRLVRLWDVTTRPARLIRQLGPHPGRVYGAQFSPDGKSMGVPCSDGTAWLWDLSTGKSRVLRGHRSEVNILRFGPQGRLVATASDDATVRLWRTDSGRPAWRAPLLRRGRHTVLTHQGWMRLGDGTVFSPPPTRWRRAVTARARRAAESNHGRRLCLLTEKGDLELWDLSGDRRLIRHALKGTARIIALAQGCLTLAGGAAELHTSSGRRHVLKRGSSAIAVARNEVLVAAGNRVTRFSLRGVKLGSFAATAGVTAVSRVGAWWVLGFGNGGIELRPTRAGLTTPRFLFDNTPTSPVVRLLPGGKQSVVAGFANGHFGLWSVQNGAVLARGQLHGAAVHLLRLSGALHAATDLGQVRRVDLRNLHLGYCQLLSQVWSAVPVIWKNGRPLRHPRPPSHRCNTRQ